MKKLSSQIIIGIVCAMLGFLLTYQFKVINNKEKSIIENYNQNDIVAEIDSLKKEKEELQKNNDSLSKRLKEMEDAAASKGDVNNQIKEQLDKTRMILGDEEVKGPGIVLTITPKSPLLTSKDPQYISEREIIHILNLLSFSGAEAISVNDIRITPQTGIKNASNFIWIGNNERISTRDSLTIKVIGNQDNLIKGIDFPGEMDYGALGGSYDYKYEKKDNIVIPKTTQKLSSEYLNKVE